MAINRYDQPAEAQFINTYVPIPFEDMMRVGLLKQARIDEDMANQEKFLTEYSSFATAPGADERIREEKLKALREDIGNAKGQPGYMDFRQEMSNIRSKYASDPEMINLKSNAKSYTELVTARKKAQEEKVTSANTLELDRKINEYYNTGTRGFKEKYGTGQLTPSSYYGNVDVRGELKKWSDAVKPSSTEEEYIDKKTGRYIVNDKNSAITMAAVARPYGVYFNKEYINGKPTISMDEEAFKNDGFQRIMSTDIGDQLKRNAKYDLERSGLPTDEESIMKRTYLLAKGHINSIVQEKIYNDSSITFDADPYALKEFSNKLDDTEQAFGYRMPMVTAGSTLVNTQAIDKAKGLSDNSIATVDQKMSLMASEHGGVKAEVQTFTGADGKPFQRTFYKGNDGEDVTDAYSKFVAEKEQYKKQKEDIENLEKKLKEKAGLAKDYAPTAEVTLRAKQAGMAAVSVLSSRTDPYDLNKDPNKPLSAAEQKVYDNAYRIAMEKADPAWSRYNGLLKENAQKQLIEVNVSRFPSTKLNTAIELEALNNFTENKPGILGGGIGGMRWAQAGELTPKEYESIDNSKEPRFIGRAIDPIDGKVKLTFRFYQKGGTKESPVLTDPIIVDAPTGVAEKMIQAGEIEQGELIIASAVSDEALGTDNQVAIPYRSNTDIKVEKLQPYEVMEEVPAGSIYKAVYPVRESSGKVGYESKYYTTRQELITEIISRMRVE
jgi:hypothetical protein